jgi:hypothetical protein
VLHRLTHLDPEQREHEDLLQLGLRAQHGRPLQDHLWKEQLFDKSWGPVSYACGSNQVYTFTGLPSGNYHFHISKVDDGVYVDGNGSVVYP